MSDNNVLTAEQMQENYEKFANLCERLGDRAAPIGVMLDELAERLATAPASSRRDFHAAYPGGLIDHSLRVMRYATTLRKHIDVYSDIPMESVVIASLFHDLGKVGAPGPDGADYYVVQDSDWHREKLGEYYKVNRDAQFMTNVDLSMLILMHYGVRLTQDEMLAIRLNDGPVDDANRKYVMREPPLALLIHQADRLACEAEKVDTQ